MLSLAVVAGMALPPFDADAGYGKIYLADPSPSPWSQTAPIVENADYFANKTLVETSPNVYEGVVDLDYSYFYFSKQLFDCDYWTYQSQYQNLDLILPKAYDARLSKVGNFDVFTSSDVNDLNAIAYQKTCWQMPAPGEYRMILNLNENKLYAIRKGAYAIVMDGQPAPTPATLGEYHTLNENLYMSESAPSFNLYDLTTDQWLNIESFWPDSSDLNQLYVKREDAPGEQFTLAIIDWPGGIINITGNPDDCFYISYIRDGAYIHTAQPCTAEKLQFTGDFNYWGTGDSALDCEQLDEEGYLWRAVLPVGTDVFKFLDGPWTLTIGAVNLECNADGSYVAYLDTSYNAWNLEFDRPATSEIVVDIDLRNMTATFPAGAQFATMYDRFHPTRNENVLYVVTPHDAITPWHGMPASVYNSFQKLNYNPENNTYSGTIYWSATPEQNDGIAFVKELTAPGAPNVVISPAASGNQIIDNIDGAYYSRGRVGRSDDFNYFCLNSSLLSQQNKVNVTVFIHSDGVQSDITFAYDGATTSNGIDQLYLGGTPTDWSINASALLPFEKINDNIFYGAFSIDPYIENSFRFFTQPGSWEAQYSIGSGMADFEEVYIEDGYSGRAYAGGLSNWTFSNWYSPMLYILVDMSDYGQVEISSTPIDVENLRKPENMAYLPSVLSNGEVSYKFAEADAMSDGTLRFTINADMDYLPRTRKLPFSPSEPEWNSSFAISHCDGEMACDESGFAEFVINVTDEISTAKVRPIRFEPEYAYHILFGTPYYNLYLDIENHRGYFERPNSKVYVVGDLTGISEGSVKDRKKLLENSVNYGGGMFYFPAGNTKFALASSIESIPNRTFRDPLSINIEERPAHSDDMNMLSMGVDYQLENWEGGNLLVTALGVYDPRQIRSMIVRASGLGEAADSLVMTQNKENPLLFTASIPYKVDLSNSLKPAIRFDLNIYNETLSLGNGVRNTMIGSAAAYLSDEGPLTENGNVKRLSIDRYNPSFRIPTLKGEGTLYVTVNIEDMTLTVDFSEAESGNVYEVVSVGNPAIDGVEVYPAARREDAVTVELDLNTASGEACEFNFTSAKGDVIVPAEGESEIVFGEDGFWIGNFTTVPSTRARARGVARAKETSKWNVNLPEHVGDKVNFLIDETEKKMVAYSSDCNTTTFYMEVYNNGRETNAAAIDVYDTLSTLVKDDDGIYRGNFEVEAQKTDVPAEVLFVKELSNTGGYYKGIFNCETSQSVIDITNEKSWDGVAIDSQFGQPVTPSTYRFSSDERMKVEVEYDPMTNAICFNPTFLGVDEVAATDNAVSVYGAHGCLVVSAGSPATLTVYNLQGMAVKTVAVGESTLRIPLSPGLYIVAGKKVVVK